MAVGSYIATPFTETWVAWLMLAMLLLVGLVQVLLPGMYARAFRSLPTTKERDSIFVGSGSDNRSRVVLTVYSVCVVALVLRWMWFGQDGFTPLSVLITAGLALAMMLVRRLMQETVAFAFFGNIDQETLRRHYHYLNDSLMLVLYPFLLFALFGWGARVLLMGILIALAAVYMLLLCYKLLALIRLSLAGLFYVPLYLFTVEVLPVACAVVAAREIV